MEQTDADFAAIERARDLPPDEPYADAGWDEPTGYCTDHGAYDPESDCPGCVDDAKA